MGPRDALTQISEIRRQGARTEVFRGYRAMPMAFSGLLALGAAGFQAVWIPDPAAHLTVYRALWVGTAILSAVAAGSEKVNHARDSASPLASEIPWLAIEEYIPCVVARGLLTIVLERSAPEVLWILLGLWQILYCLGLFASCRLETHVPPTSISSGRSTYAEPLCYDYNRPSQCSRPVQSPSWLKRRDLPRVRR